MHPTGQTVYLVSCVSQKRDRACAARDLYISDLFRKARCCAEASGCPWFILSAEYGLVSPDQVIAPYERTLNTMQVAERRAWAERVARQLAETVPDLARVVLIAGARYREFLAEHLNARSVSVSIPMEGLRIGEQLSWLSQRASQVAPQRTASESVAHAASLYRRGITCPAEMWRVLFDSLPDEKMADFLDGLPGDAQIVLREAFSERPESLQGVSRQHPGKAAVQQWCAGR
jgi:hypothetical protein